MVVLLDLAKAFDTIDPNINYYNNLPPKIKVVTRTGDRKIRSVSMRLPDKFSLNLVLRAFSSTIFKIAARLNIVEEKALGTRLNFHCL